MTSITSCRLDDIAAFITSGPRGWADKYTDTGAAFIRITNLQRESIRLDLSKLKYVRIPPGGTEGQRTRLQPGDILISITADLGIVGLVRPGEFDEGYINQHIALVRLRNNAANPEYVAYFLSSIGQQELQRRNDAGSKAGLNLDSIRTLPLQLPCYEIQCYVAKMLNCTEDALERFSSLIAAKTEFKRALAEQLLTGRLRFPEFAGTTCKECSLSEYAVKEKGCQVSQNSIGLGMPYIGSAGFDGKVTTFTETTNGVLCQQNDVLILWDGEYAGKVATGLVGVASSTVAVLRIKPGLNPSFLFQTMRADNTKIMAIREGSGIPHLPGDFLMRYRIRVPGINEQRKIADVLGLTDEEIRLLRRQRDALKQQKEGLMQKLLTGEIRLKEFAP